MQRRHYLRALSGSALIAVVGGCLEDPETVGSTTPGPTTGPARTTSEPADGADDGTASRGVAVVSVETFPLALRLNDAGPPPGGAPTVDAFDGSERAVVEAALDGSYATDRVPEWLARFASETSYVRHDGSFYVLDADLPVHVVTAEPVDRDAVDGEIATQEEYREAVTFEKYVFTGFARVALNEGYRTHFLQPKLRAFVERYAATEYRGDVLGLDYSIDDPGLPYTITAEPSTPAAVYGGSVLFADETAPEVAELLRAAGPTEGLYRVADPPENLASLVRRHRYVHADGQFYHAYVETGPTVPVAFDATAIGPSDGDPRVRVSLTNEGERPFQVFSGAPPPFGVLHAIRVDGSDGREPSERATLWTDAYEASDHVFVENGDVTGWNSIGLTTAVAPGATVARSFRLRSDEFAPGEWVVENNLGIEVRPTGEDPDDAGAPEAGGTLPYRVRVRLDER